MQCPQMIAMLFMWCSGQDEDLLFSLTYSPLAAAEPRILDPKSTVSSCHLEILKKVGKGLDVRMPHTNSWSSYNLHD